MCVTQKRGNAQAVKRGNLRLKRETIRFHKNGHQEKDCLIINVIQSSVAFMILAVGSLEPPRPNMHGIFSRFKHIRQPLRQQIFRRPAVKYQAELFGLLE
jgi:hypothetical protein